MASIVVAVAFTLYRLLFFEGPFLPPEPLNGKPIVDLHAHVAGLGAKGSGCFVSDEMRNSYKFEIYLSAFDVSRKMIEEQGDALVVRRLAERVRESEHLSAAVVLALDGVIGEDGELDREHTEIFVPNDFVGRETARFPELLFGASINPYRRDAIERLEQVAGDGAVLIKWLPAIQWIDPSDEALIPFYEKMKELDLPLLSHAGQERSFTTARDEFSDPFRLRLPLELGIRVVAAHAASTGTSEGQDNVDRLVELLDEFPNLYADISTLTQLNKLGFLRRVLQERRFDGRLLYGSDYPLIHTVLLSPWYHPLNLTLAEMRGIRRIDNPLDRDVVLKQSLGVPAAVFARSATFLGARAARPAQHSDAPF